MNAREQTERSAPAERRNRKGRVLKLGMFVVFLLVTGYFIGRSIDAQWAAIRNHPWRLQWSWMLCSAGIMWVDFLIIMWLWQYLLHVVSGRWLSLARAFRVLVLANLGKYLPGKVWTVLGMVYLLRQEGFAVPATLASTVLHQAFTVISGGVLVGAVLGRSVPGGMPVALSVAVLLLGAVILYPPLFSRLLNWALRIAGREPVQFSLSFCRAVGLFLAYMMTWVVYGASFWCMLRGVGITPGGFWETIAAFSGAYLLGFLALFAPGGLGVREGALAVLLAPQIGPGLAGVIAVGSRLWMTLLELTQLIPLAFGWGRLRSTHHDPA